MFVSALHPPDHLLISLHSFKLWHSTNAAKPICLGNTGFDIRRMKSRCGHVYGHGAYFAEFAIYAHWWFNRSKPEVVDKSAERYTLLLAQVFTGRSKDYGSAWAPDLVVEPCGYHSVCGTESDQRLLPVVRARPSPYPMNTPLPSSVLFVTLTVIVRLHL